MTISSPQKFTSQGLHPEPYLANATRPSRLRATANGFGGTYGRGPGHGGDPLSRMCVHPASELWPLKSSVYPDFVSGDSPSRLPKKPFDDTFLAEIWCYNPHGVICGRTCKVSPFPRPRRRLPIVRRRVLRYWKPN